MFVFHPWEFTDITDYHLPWYAKRHCGELMLKKLTILIRDLKKEADFITMQDYVERNARL